MKLSAILAFTIAIVGVTSYEVDIDRREYNKRVDAYLAARDALVELAPRGKCSGFCGPTLPGCGKGCTCRRGSCVSSRANPLPK
jgi:hypothetical protein